MLNEYILDTYCRVLAFNEYQYDRGILNEYMKVLSSGSCTDKFSISENAWSQVINNPPVRLTEPYKQCHKNAERSFFDSSGIALANTYSFMPVIAFLVVNIYTFCCLCLAPEKGKQQSAEKFKRSERMEVNDIVSNHILQELFRRKYESDKKSPQNEVINDLADVVVAGKKGKGVSLILSVTHNEIQSTQFTLSSLNPVALIHLLAHIHTYTRVYVFTSRIKTRYECRVSQ